MNQMGEIQPIGGVNAKIEGYFAACQLKGFTGTQGVIIPQQNVRHLMLRTEILQAVEQGLFRIYAVNHAEQALELLLGEPMGVANNKGKYPKNSILIVSSRSSNFGIRLIKVISQRKIKSTKKLKKQSRTKTITVLKSK